MKKNKASPVSALPKARTGIEGFDVITRGGLPRGRVTLLEGDAGAGKTIMALQTLIHGVCHENEPGIFVAFEESSESIRQNAKSFGWDLEDLEKKSLFILDAQPTPDLFQSGSFDLSGLLAVLEAKAKEINARRIVLDAVDVLLALLHDPVAERREIYRLHDWLLHHELTAIITAKTGSLLKYDNNTANRPQMGFMQFMVDCAVTLNHDVVHGVSQRSLRIVKYRGSAYSENESPFLIAENGLEVASDLEMSQAQLPTTAERMSSGVRRLNAMLGGGYYRNASVLVTGVPGTAKSTLAGAFAEASCLRGEKTLYVSFDSKTEEMVRNLTSVNIHLARFIKKGLLRMMWARSITGSAEAHLMRIKKAAREHGATCVVIDPVSALAKAGNENTASSVAERLFDWTKAGGITLLCTSLLEDAATQVEGTPLQISTLSDTWIHLNYLVNAGERNRGLSIIKSRGTAHSNQVRELILTDSGVTLADVYTAGGEVLMGTLRWEKERAERIAMQEAQILNQQKQTSMVMEEAELEARLNAVQAVLDAKRAEKQALKNLAADRAADLARREERLRQLRGKDEM